MCAIHIALNSLLIAVENFVAQITLFHVTLWVRGVSKCMFPDGLGKDAYACLCSKASRDPGTQRSKTTQSRRIYSS